MEKDEDAKLTDDVFKQPVEPARPAHAETDEEADVGQEIFEPDEFDDDSFDDEKHPVRETNDSFLSGTDSGKALLALAKKYPELSAGAELKLFKIIVSKNPASAESTRAKDILARHTLWLVVALAKQPRPGCEFVDLCQEGWLEIYAAIDGFDPNLGKRFASFAHSHIKGAMAKYWRDHGRCIRLPENGYEDLAELKKHVHKYQMTHARGPTTNELATLMNWKDKKVRLFSALLEGYEIKSLTNDLHDVEQESVVHSLWQEDAADEPYISAERAEQLDALFFELNRLPALEQEAIRLRYFANLELVEVGAQLNRSRQDAKNMVKRALRKLRKRLGGRWFGIGRSIRNAVTGKAAPAARNPVVKHDSDEEVSKARELLWKGQYHFYVDALMAVVLDYLLPNGKTNKEAIVDYLAASIETGRLTPMSDDPSDADPRELADFAISHLFRARRIEQTPSGECIKITPIGVEWLDGFTRRQQRIKRNFGDSPPR